MKTFKDVYKFPFVKDKFIPTKINDSNSNGNFVFEFLFDSKEKIDLTLSVINGDTTFESLDLKFFRKGVHIYGVNSRIPYIRIRGWGNLTGIGAMNLSAEEAANIQDTLADYIVEQLNKRDCKTD